MNFAKFARTPFLQNSSGWLHTKCWLAVWLVSPERYCHANWKSTDKWSLTCFKNILKVWLSNYLLFCCNLLVKVAILLKSNLLFSSFHCLFYLWTKLYGVLTWTRTVMNAKFHSLLFVLKQSDIRYYKICMTVPLKKPCGSNSRSKVLFLKSITFRGITLNLNLVLICGNTVCW